MLDLRTLSAGELRRRFASERSGRLVLTRLVRATLVQALADIRAGREPRVEGNIRTFWYRWLKPIVGRLAAEDLGRLDPYRVLVHELAEMVGSERQFDYADFGFADDNWENRRIGVGRPQVIVFAEKAGWFQLLRRVHAAHDVTVLALGGKPSLLTSEYTARHVKAALAAAGLGKAVSLLALVDWDPDGAIVASSFAEQLGVFGLEVRECELLIRPERFDAEALRLFGHEVRATTMARRWLAGGGGIEGRLVGLSAEAMAVVEAEALVAERVRQIAPEVAAAAVVHPQEVAVAAWRGRVGGDGEGLQGADEVGVAGTLEVRRLGEVGRGAVERAEGGEVTVMVSRGEARAVLVPVLGSGD